MGNVKMQKIDLCVIQDHDLAQVFLRQGHHFQAALDRQ